MHQVTLDAALCIETGPVLLTVIAGRVLDANKHIIVIHRRHEKANDVHREQCELSSCNSGVYPF